MPILGISYDFTSSRLAVALATGEVIFLQANYEVDWKLIKTYECDLDIPAVSICNLQLGGKKSLFVCAYINGIIKLFNSETCGLEAEIGAHSRQINALICHP